MLPNLTWSLSCGLLKAQEGLAVTGLNFTAFYEALPRSHRESTLANGNGCGFVSSLAQLKATSPQVSGQMDNNAGRQGLTLGFSTSRPGE